MVGLGSAENARRFARALDFPLDLLYAGEGPAHAAHGPQNLGSHSRLLVSAAAIPSAVLYVSLSAVRTHADSTGACYKALGFSPGFGSDLAISPYLKLLPMLMGIGSPGTMQEV